MTDGSQYTDIIFFALVAIFVALRLRSVLGRRTGNERPHLEVEREEQGSVVDLGRRRRRSFDSRTDAPPANNPVEKGLNAIASADRSFNRDYFQNGAAAAFEMIVAAFARGDVETLTPLLAPAVLQNFTQAIAARAPGEIHETQVSHISGLEIVEAGLEKTIATVKVRFTSQQIHVVKDASGQIIEGNPDQIVHMRDLWTFTRDVASNNPNWLLTAAESLD